MAFHRIERRRTNAPESTGAGLRVTVIRVCPYGLPASIFFCSATVQSHTLGFGDGEAGWDAARCSDWRHLAHQDVLAHAPAAPQRPPRSDRRAIRTNSALSRFCHVLFQDPSITGKACTRATASYSSGSHGTTLEHGGESEWKLRRALDRALWRGGRFLGSFTEPNCALRNPPPRQSARSSARRSFHSSRRRARRVVP